MIGLLKLGNLNLNVMCDLWFGITYNICNRVG